VEAAVGFSTHSGWAVAIVAGLDGDGHLRVADRRRVELIDGALPRQAYHAAKALPPGQADALVERVERAITARAVDVLSEMRTGPVPIVAVAVVGEPREIPDVATVLASHARMHACEGEQYRRAIVEAAGELGLATHRAGPAALAGLVAAELGWAPGRAERELAAVRAELGPPWQQDHKHAALAALLALAGITHRAR
jgi:hypothetical protein